MTVDDGDPVGVYFGTTSGEMWASADEGATWTLHRRAPARDLLGRVRRPVAGVKVRIPTPLRSYTGQQAVVEADGATVGELLADLDRQLPRHRASAWSTSRAGCAST